MAIGPARPRRGWWIPAAAALLIGGGLKTLQTASICTGLPFAIILLLMIYSLYIGFSQEHYVEDTVRKKLEEVEQQHFMEEAIKEYRANGGE